MTGVDLRNRRRALGLTQAELAEYLGVAANTVARWERGARIPAERSISLALSAIERSGAVVAPGTEAGHHNAQAVSDELARLRKQALRLLDRFERLNTEANRARYVGAGQRKRRQALRLIDDLQEMDDRMAELETLV